MCELSIWEVYARETDYRPLCSVVRSFTFESVRVANVVPVLLVELVILDFTERFSPEDEGLLYRET